MLIFKKFGILGAVSELLEPHLFGKTGDLEFGTNIFISDRKKTIIKIHFAWNRQNNVLILTKKEDWTGIRLCIS